MQQYIWHFLFFNCFVIVNKIWPYECEPNKKIAHGKYYSLIGLRKAGIFPIISIVVAMKLVEGVFIVKNENSISI